MKPATAYVINPRMQTVQRMVIRDYHDIYKAGGYDCFDCARFNDLGDGVYIDDDGLLKANPMDNFFSIVGYPDPLCGNGVVLGTDDEGESVDPAVSWDEFKELVRRVMVLKVNGHITFLYEPLKFIDEIVDATAPAVPE